jgi:hypothetical protein
MACSADSPIACPDRRAEQLAGQMFYLWGVGWLWLRSRDVTRPWQSCPWCGEALPTMQGTVERLQRNGWADTLGNPEE